MGCCIFVFTKPLSLFSETKQITVTLSALVQTNDVSPKQIAQGVYMEADSSPYVPRKRIRGMYPPSGLKSSSFGSSSSCSYNKLLFNKPPTTSHVNQAQRSKKKNHPHNYKFKIFLFQTQPWQLITILLILFRIPEGFPHLQVDHNKVVCQLSNLLRLCKFWLERW